MSGLNDLTIRRAGYVPTFAPQPGGPGEALLEIAGSQLDALAARLEQAPDKRGLALLDLVGVGLVPASAARAPVIFQSSPGLDYVTAPAGTRLGAKVPGQAEPLTFETERTVAISSSRLVEVATVVPGADAYTSHIDDLGAGKAVLLFDSTTPFTHELYLGHSTFFVLAGRAHVEIVVALRAPSSTPLALEASWWDGKSWRSFAPFADPAGDEDSSDGTVGLTRGGTIRLFTPCGDSKPLAVHGVTSSWVRLDVKSAIPGPAPVGTTFPHIERLRVRTVVERRRVAQRLSAAAASEVALWSADGAPIANSPISVSDVTNATTAVHNTNASGSVALSLVSGHAYRLALGATPTDADWMAPFTATPVPTKVDLLLQHGLLPDKALSDGRSVDPTKTFAPLGPNPDPGSALYLACVDAFTRAGAEVALEIHRPKTAAEQADDQAAQYEVQVNAAIALVHSIESQLNAIADSLDALRIAKDLTGIDIAAGPLGQPLPPLLTESTAAWYQDLKDTLTTLISIAGSASNQITNLLSVINDIVGGIFGGPAGQEEGQKRAAAAAVAIAKALEALGVNDPNLVNNRVQIETILNGPSPLDIPMLLASLAALQGAIAIIVANPGQFMQGNFPPFLTMLPEDYIVLVVTRLQQATTAVFTASNNIRAIVALLLGFNPANLVVANGGLIPALAPPVIAWEYWDGTRWTLLPGLGNPQPGPTAANLQASGVVRFTVPEAWTTTTVAGDQRQWLRARLAQGHFSRLRVVTWTDAKSNLVNVLPVVEPRPPSLDRIEVTYRSASDLEAPEEALGYDDAEWHVHTPLLGWPGPGFQPFRACRDTSPAMYLGFDSPVPPEEFGLLLEVDERPDQPPVALRFEAWSGTEFVSIPAEDGTGGLTTPGVIYLVPPQQASAASLVVRASGTSVILGEPGAGLRYQSGSSLWLTDQRGGELVDVAVRTGDALTLVRPLSRAYAGGYIRLAPPARFGHPLTWIRILLDADVMPPEIRLRSISGNAVWASNVESLVAENVGGSDGTPGQVHFMRRWPVLTGESVEVRELSGPRADVDWPMLAQELRDANSPDALRLVRDSAGHVSEAWVRWTMRDTLAFSDGHARGYCIDRSRGRLIFGDGRFGRIPPSGSDNIIVTYRAGGAASGNLPAGAITAVLSGVLARGVANPLPAEGGAGGESLTGLRSRGPLLLRHRHQAMSAGDYEALALEASAAIARVRALGAVDAAGRPAAGYVRVVIVPNDNTPAPQPNAELKRQVAALLRRRSPLTALSGPAITVSGPRYESVGVDITVDCLDLNKAASVREAVRVATLAFLHPVTGGDGRGFEFGDRIATSDLARVISVISGVDAVVHLSFQVEGLPQSDFIALEPDALPTAGLINVSLTAVN